MNETKFCIRRNHLKNECNTVIFASFCAQCTFSPIRWNGIYVVEKVKDKKTFRRN